MLKSELLCYPNTLVNIKENLIKTSKGYKEAENYYVFRHFDKYYVSAWISSPDYKNFPVTEDLDKKSAYAIKKYLKGKLNE